MKSFKTIFVIWLTFLGVLGVSMLFPHWGFNSVSLLSVALRFLLFMLSLFLFVKEPNRSNKYIFLNFLLFFSFSILHHLYNFIGSSGSIFVDERYAQHYYYQYVDRLGFYLFLSVAVVYTVLDSLFRHFKTYQKYAFTLLIVGGFTAFNYHSYFSDPKYLYSTQDIRDWKALDLAWSKYVQEHGLNSSTEPDPNILAGLVTLRVWDEGSPVGDLYPERNRARIEYLTKYLVGRNYEVLLWKPMNLNVIKMNVVCLFFLFLFFGYQYKKDPPQGAYVDKIMFLFLLFCSMEALHAWGYIKAIDWSTTLVDVFSFGQYITIGILMFMVLFFSLRLRFITSVKGEFYESELVHNAEHITRWRDWVDNLIVHYFLNPKALRGRFLALWTEKGKGELAKTAH